MMYMETVMEYITDVICDVLQLRSEGWIVSGYIDVDE